MMMSKRSVALYLFVVLYCMVTRRDTTTVVPHTTVTTDEGRKEGRMEAGGSDAHD